MKFKSQSKMEYYIDLVKRGEDPDKVLEHPSELSPYDSGYYNLNEEPPDTYATRFKSMIHTLIDGITYILKF